MYKKESVELVVVKIYNKSIHVELHHLICKAAEDYYRLSGNIPKALLVVNQHIHGHFDGALYNVFTAANTSDKKLKLDYLNRAKLGSSVETVGRFSI